MMSFMPCRVAATSFLISAGFFWITSSAAMIACDMLLKYLSDGMISMFIFAAWAWAVQSGTAAIASAWPAMNSFQTLTGPTDWAFPSSLIDWKSVVWGKSV